MPERTSRAGRARLRLIGRFLLCDLEGRAVAVPSRRARALLAYLALAPEQAASRERLCGLLWSDRAEPQARASLRQCLLELRQILSAAELDLLEVGRDLVGLRARAVVTDVAELEAALLAGGDASGDALATIGSAPLLDDLDVPGLFEEWRGQAAARLDQLIIGAVESHLGALERQGAWAKARALAETYLRRDPLNEPMVASAIRAEMALGAAGAAHRRFQGLQTALTRELGVSPGPAVRDALTASAPPRLEGVARAEERAPLPLPEQPSIAVLPFKNLSGDPDREYVADGITEDLVAALSRWRWFFVIARNSSFAYKDSNVDPDRAGRELGVRYILDGSVRLFGQKVRVSARLIDTADGAYVWTDLFDKEFIHVLDLQDEITERVAASIAPAILHGEGLRVVRKHPADLSVLDCFYRGMWHLNNMSEESDVEALSLFREVIRRDADLPLGYVGLARILYSRAVFGASATSVEDLRAARAAADTAIRLDARDAHGYFARSATSLYLGDHGGALSDARRAVDINPNFALAHVRLGQALIFIGKPAEAIEPIERGLRLNPYDPQLSVSLNLLGLAHYQARRYDQAAVEARAAMHQAREPSSLVLAVSLARLGRLDEAQGLLPTGPWTRSFSRPLAPKYLMPGDLEHLREGIRLARGTRAPDQSASPAG